MTIQGRRVVLAGAFRAGGRDELTRRLAALGARTDGSVSADTDVLFVGSDPGDAAGEAERLGVPMLPESELYEALLAAAGRTDDDAPVDGGSGTGVFLLPGALRAAGDDPAALLALLRDADWAAFTPAVDLLPLRDELARSERRHGVTAAHRLATGRLRALGARLRHPHARGGVLHDVALSPCGRYLATGRGPTEDDICGPGPLQIWELATGRCVNTVDEIDEGVGWSGTRGTIQWSADGTRLALAFRTNNVGVWDPFGAEIGPCAVADVTDGAGSPPAFALSPNGRQAYVSVFTGHELAGCVVSLGRGRVHQTEPWSGDEAGARPFTEPLPDEVRAALGEPSLSFERVRWSRDGSHLLGHSRPWAFVVDLPGGLVRWMECTVDHAAFSPDDRLVASIGWDPDDRRRTELILLDAATGAPVCEPVPQAPGSPHWGTRAGAARLAVVTQDGRGVDVYHEDGRGQYHLDIAATPNLGRTPFASLDHPWSWAPSGGHGACLTADGRIEVWALDAEPARTRSIDVPEDTTGVLWGADGVLVAFGEYTLRFVRALTGEVLGDVRVDREFDRKSGPVDDDRAHLHGMFRADVFALDDGTWCATALPAAGPAAALVIAPEARRADLDAVLAWTVDRRYAWPVRWGDLDLVADRDTAVAALRGC
ncbi:MAG: hypothetical protein WCA46_10885 [Actinocatenispora sp.]